MDGIDKLDIDTVDLTQRIVSPALGDQAGITGAIELGRRALTGETP